MNRSDATPSARDQALLILMHEHGDSILRTCFLLCGSERKAHRYARQVFIRASLLSAPQLWESAADSLPQLLHLSFAVCPCRICLRAFLPSPEPINRMLRLPPSQRRIAILCLHHDMSLAQASALCGIRQKRAAHLLILAKRHLK